MEELLKILIYFDVFSYPLTADELFRYAGVNNHKREGLEKELHGLVRKGLINEHTGYFYIGEKKDTVRRRKEGNRRAINRMKSARRYSRIIANFPYVRGVSISGSISKGYAAEDDDIDYFIVTSPGRLWLTRSLLILFKKLFLGNSYRNFCVNYFVDTNHLRIPQQNRFTATEIAFLLPTFNSDIHKSIMDANTWIKSYYPGFSENGEPVNNKTSALKVLFEKILNNGLGDRLEKKLFKLSGRIIRTKYRHMDDNKFAGSFSIKPHELKYLPNHQQYRIMKSYYQKLALFELQNGFDLINHQSRLQLSVSRPQSPLSRYQKDKTGYNSVLIRYKTRKRQVVF